ncbi:MAG: amidohydrolase [Ignavibacteriae bacterium]|nr:amidohydrolase [Ignavibacteriota bacterium]
MHPQLKFFLIFLGLAVISLLIYMQLVPQQVDTLYVNAKIYTLDEDNSTANALAVSGSRIAGVGQREDLEKKYRPNAVVDLGGKTVIPGLIDAHAHVVSLGVARLTVDLVGSQSERDAAERVEARVRQVENTDVWVRGRGWDQNDWASRHFPTRASLDRVAPDNPVVLTRVDGHAIWVNSRALEIAGVTSETADPPGGKIHRDAAGNPTGVFIDEAMQLIRQHLPPLSEEELIEAASIAAQECASLGLTSVHDMGVDSEEIAVYQKMIDSQQLPIRVYAAIGGVGETWNEYLQKGPLHSYGDHQLSVRAIKMYMDGALGSRGAALIEPYSDDPGNRGLTLTTEEVFRKTVDEAIAHGFQVCTHAIGDRGNNLVLNTYEAALNENPQSDARLRVEHAQVLHPNDIPRFKELNVIPSMQQTHCTSDMYWAEARLGPQRVRGAYAWRSLLESGVVIPGGSDFPVEHPNPMLGIYAAVTRRDAEGRPHDADDIRKYFQLSREGITDPAQFADGWYASQKMTREEALRSFTSWAAYASFEEDLKGSLEAGKLADFIVLSDDIMNVPARQIPHIAVVLTILGGKTVYEKMPSQAHSQE